MLLFDDILTLEELEFYSNNIPQENTEPYIFDKNKKPKNLQEELILKIFNEKLNMMHIANFIEYWINTNDKDHNEYYHIDKNELLLEQKNILSVPLHSAVMYLWKNNIQGGHLRIYEGPTKTEYYEKIKPVQNRLCIFEGGYTLHGVEKIYSGIRCSLSLGFWEEKPLFYE
tara:strand:+ start:437 stop:949 length:513 start_codon:yes stop_codon:yes gene_type:complete